MIDFLELALGWIHVVSVAIWIGGALFITIAVDPSVKEFPRDVAIELSRSIDKRFGPAARTAAVLIGLTGLLRAFYQGSLDTSVLAGTEYGYVLSVKMAIFVVMFGMGIIINYIGRKLSKNPSPEYIGEAQKRIKLLSTSIVVLGLIAIALAVRLSIIH